MKVKCIGYWHLYQANRDFDGPCCGYHMPCGWEGEEDNLDWVAPKPNNIVANGDERCCPGCRGNVELTDNPPPRIYGPGKTMY